MGGHTSIPCIAIYYTSSTLDKVVLYKHKSLLLHSHEEDRQKLYKSIYTLTLGSNRCCENKIRQDKRVKSDEKQASRNDLAEDTTLEQRPEGKAFQE